jgi:hypothetical protein
MNELQRQSYLEVMGVDILVPRFVLPGAKPTVACELPELILPTPHLSQALAYNEESNVPPPDQLSAKASRATVQVPDKAGQIAGAVGKSIFQVGENDQSAGVDTRIPDRLTSDKVPRFQLLVSYSGKGVVLVVANPVEKLPSAQQKLLNSIVFAIDGGSSWKHESFRWPLHRDKRLEQGAAAARQTLQGFINARFFNPAAGGLVVFGRAAAHFIVPEGIPEDSPEASPLENTLTAGQVPITEIAKPVIITYSLEQYLSRPLLKRQLWQQLESLLIEKH